MKRTLGALLAAAALIVGMSGVSPAFATSSAAPSGTTSGAALNPHAGWVSDATLAKNPSLRAELGLNSESSPSSSASDRSHASSDHMPAVEPATSGLKCGTYVCAKVYGTGLYISEIYTTAIGNHGCITANYQIYKTNVNGPLVHSAEGSVVCPSTSGSGVYYYYFDNQVPDRMPYACQQTSELTAGWDTCNDLVGFLIHA